MYIAAEISEDIGFTDINDHQGLASPYIHTGTDEDPPCFLLQPLSPCILHVRYLPPQERVPTGSHGVLSLLDTDCRGVTCHFGDVYLRPACRIEES